jgi:hypothetical protein
MPFRSLEGACIICLTPMYFQRKPLGMPIEPSQLAIQPLQHTGRTQRPRQTAPLRKGPAPVSSHVRYTQNLHRTHDIFWHGFLPDLGPHDLLRITISGSFNVKSIKRRRLPARHLLPAIPHDRVHELVRGAGAVNISSGSTCVPAQNSEKSTCNTSEVVDNLSTAPAIWDAILQESFGMIGDDDVKGRVLKSELRTNVVHLHGIRVSG